MLISFLRECGFAISVSLIVKLTAMNTLMPEEFKSFVMRVVREKEKCFVLKRRMEIDVAPEFHKILKSS